MTHSTVPSAEEIAGRAKKIVRQKLESLARSGIGHLGKPTIAAGSPPPLAKQPPVLETSKETVEMAKRPTKSISAGDRLEIIQKEVAACTRCAELVSHRSQTVFGVGNPKARLCFLGEAPGADEDRQGEPFVGRSGQLLTKIIEACTLHREDVYILNILKCRPPGNRPPEASESANCRAFLNRQLALIKPEFICCLGATAAQNLLETTTPIGQMRGQIYEYQGIKVVCTYHPAYLLRNPPAKRHTWDDMKLLMREMGIELPNQKNP